MKELFILTVINTLLLILLFVPQGLSFEESELEIGTGRGEQVLRPMRFNNPKIRYKQTDKFYRLDLCYNVDEDCGNAAAHVFCKEHGFRIAKEFEIDWDIGDVSPTLTLGDSKICNKSYCDGYKYIDCTE